MSRSFALALLASSALIAPAVHADELPTGGQLAAGAASIATTPGALTITQSSDRAVINWQSFSLGAGGRIDIAQPGSGSALLNRVIGSTTSMIAGQIQANGQVFLVNPNGILITATGSVSAAGFVASSLNLTDSQFMNGDIIVTGRGGSVVNHGNITIVKGGYAALIGGSVDNSGMIVAPLGKVALGSGTRATLDLTGDGFLQIAVPSPDVGGVAMSGRISADGGTVLLSAASALDAARHTVNLSGTIEARGVEGHSGVVVLTGGAITLAGATIDVSGVGGGGSVRIGGDRQGFGNLVHVDTVGIDAGSTIDASATVVGNGGNVVVWSDIATTFAGTIVARGAGGGSGGNAEVSSHGRLGYNGTADLTGGTFGTLLLDPFNVTISTAASADQSAFTATGNDSVINAGTLTSALGLANVTVSTGSSGTQAGTITVTAPLVWTSAATLRMNAAGAIDLNADITADGGGLILNSGGIIGVSGAVSVAGFTLAGGSWAQNSATLPGFTAGDFAIAAGSFLRVGGGDGAAATPYLLTDIFGLQGVGSSDAFRAAKWQFAIDIDASGTAGWNAGAGFVPIGDNASRFTGTLNGTGHVVRGLVINRPAIDQVGLVGDLGAGGMINGVGIAGGTVTGYDSVGGLAGYNRGLITQSYVTGAVSGFTIVGGLVGLNYGGTVSQSYATGAVSGTYQVGGLVGLNYTGTIRQSYATGAASGTDQVGGLVGYNYNGAVGQTYAVGAVSGASYVGGLIGYNYNGTVSQSHATGAVAGTISVGGLVGDNVGPISQSYATGEVVGTDDVGGLVGYNSAAISQSYATGRVSGTAIVGGLVGSNYGTLIRDYWDTDTSARTNAVGAGDATGATGLTTAQARSAASYVGFDFGSVWYQAADLRPILRSEAAAAVNGVITVSNLHQLQLMTINLGGSYLLASDIDASSTRGSDAAGIFGPAGFVPIGTDVAQFTGTLNGTGHVVSGLTINRSTTDYVGLVGYLGAGGQISAVGIAGGSVVGRTRVGGLVGQNGGTVGQSYATSAVSGTNGMGGLVGYNAATISQSYATGPVSGTLVVGGLAGYNIATISQSYASGAVSGTNLVGGLVGYNFETLIGNYWDTDTTGRSFAVGGGNATGVTRLTTAQARSAASYPDFDFGSVWYQAADLRPILRAEAATPVNGVVTVSNLHQLQLMNINLGASYRLTNDIDAAATSGTDAAGIFGPAGFVPIGDYTSRFTGALDGADHVVSGLVIDRLSTSYVGFVGYLGTGGKVSRLSIDGGRITGDTNVGGLVGTSLGTVDRSFTTGAINGRSGIGGLVGVSGGLISQSYAIGTVGGTELDIGGLVGNNLGAVSQSYAAGNVGGALNTGGLSGRNSGTVDQSYATGTVSGTDTVGGLIGTLDFGTVSRSYATGTVSGANGVGGLVGFSNSPATVSQSYATGAVNGTVSFVSGLVAYNYGTIIQSYATGAVKGSGFVGGLTGLNGGTMISVYWDTETTKQTRADGFAYNGGAGATGRTTAQMQDVTTFRAIFAGFDFATVWAPPSDAAHSSDGAAHYPELYAVSNVIAATAGSGTRIYGDGAGAFSPNSYTGVQPGGTVTALGSVSGATPTSNVGSYATLLSGVGAKNAGGLASRVVYVPGAETVTVRPVTITADAQSRLYGAANPELTFAYTSLGAGADLVGALASASPASDAGSYAITQNTLTNAANPNYSLTYVGNTMSVTPAPLKITANDASKLYGAALPTLTASYAGFVNGDTSASLIVRPSFATTATAASSVAGSPYTITASGAYGSNYVISYVPGNFAINQAPLIITADNASKVYGAVLPTLTTSYSGFVNGDTSASLTTGPSVATTATAASNVASSRYTITASGAFGSNYVISYVTGNLAINQAPLIIPADNANKVYGAALPTLSASYAGFVNGDTFASLTTGPILTTTATSSSNVAGGPYAISASGAASSNYDIRYAAGALTVTPATLSVTADAQGRIYGNANPVLSYASAGLVFGDVLTGGLTTPATPASGIGAYGIAQGDLTAGDNYSLNYTGSFLTIAPRPLVIAAAATSRIYGDVNPPLTYTIGALGLVNGDVLAGDLTTIAAGATGIGAYAILQGTVAATANYSLRYIGAELAVTPRALIITADATRQLYGNANPTTGTATGDNLVNGDAVTRVDLDTSAVPASSVGSYALGASNATGTGLGNYTLRYAIRADGHVVTVRPVTVMAYAQSRRYGDANPPLAYTSTSLGAGAPLNGMLAASATVASPVGAGYAITQGSLTNAANPNYDLTYVGSLLTVGQRPLTITADALTRSYGDANPALTYTLGGSGLANNDTLGGALATVATETSGIGSYAIARGTLTTSPNYAVNYLGHVLTIVPRALIVSADDKTRHYGEANPTLTYTVGVRGLVNGDILTGALAVAAAPTSSPAPYQIQQATLAASANYALSYVPGTLTVEASRILPTDANAATLARDAFSTDTRPVTSGASLVGGNDTPGDASVLLTSPLSATPVFCPKGQVCPTDAP